MARVECKLQHLLISRLPLHQLGYTLVVSTDVACSFSLVSVNAGKKPGIGPAEIRPSCILALLFVRSSFQSWCNGLKHCMS